jgi:hypothetical protein
MAEGTQSLDGIISPLKSDLGASVTEEGLLNNLSVNAIVNVLIANDDSEKCGS